MKKITGRCIWITGASSGLGRALAIQLAEAGNFVIASARSQSPLAELAAHYPGNIKSLPMDFSHNINLKQAAEQLYEITDYLDMVICAAGICRYEDNFEFNPELYQQTMDINFLGIVRAFNLALPLLKKSQTRAQFVAISSLSSCVGFARAEAYGASKAAINYLMQSLRVDFSRLPLDFTVVRPGFVATQLTEHNDFAMPGLITAEQASAHIVKKLAARPFMIDFPKRLSWPLRLGGVFFNSWCRWVAPRITRLQHW